MSRRYLSLCHDLPWAESIGMAMSGKEERIDGRVGILDVPALGGLFAGVAGVAPFW
jgi:hypothetical protein